MTRLLGSPPTALILSPEQLLVSARNPLCHSASAPNLARGDVEPEPAGGEL